MRSPIRRRSAVLAIGVFGLSAGAMAPGAFAAGSDDDVKVSNTETVQVAMDASGHIDAKRVYEQLVLTGNGKVDLANPISTKGLRNLDGFRGYDVKDGAVHIKTDVDGTKKYRSVSDFTKKLPLDIKVTYTLDGKKMDPSDIVGKSGKLEVRYVVTNVTGTTEDVPFTNGEGKTETAPQEVVVPMVGTLDTTLPSSFTKVVPDGANAAGDGRGGTMLSFTMTLIPPIGKATAEIGYTAQVKDATIPKADISALPVNPLENVSFKGGAEAYKGGAETGQDLTAGATEINANVLKLRDGASDLLAGILKLRDGADQLSSGLNGEAVPGAKKLADGSSQLDAGASKLQDGTGKLSAGADKLDAGAGQLADGLAEASGGAPALLDGVAKLKAGAQQVDAGLVKLQQTVAGGVGSPAADGTLRNGVAKLIGGLGGVDTGLDGVDGALAGALQLANSLDDTVPQKPQLVGAITGAKNGVASLKGAISALKTGAGSLDGGLQQLAGGVTAGVGAPSTDKTLRNGIAQLIGGLDQLTDKGGDLVAGLDKLAAGADQLSDGTGDLSAGAGDLNAGAGDLKAGTGQLSAGAGDLAGGLGTAAAGSAKLAAGLGTAAEGAPKLPEGAERLSKEGTSKVVESGKETAMDFGQRYALLEAGAKRAASAQPYGSPEGATALTAYKFEIAGEDGSGTANVTRGLAAIALMVAAGGFATARRRGLI
ncbi:hypothetical protein ASE12_01255 [Aeromicrobium sp. Root236]|uniref:hypothetical protein n=1 Tax=Aeromicrobium sp. Root236 TaxID=1736498 RepID=UPI0006FABFF3|nr:hypothetical protein [Aeromicrobium sp. Root236]KRC63507.1 hypothetical protein ASE12_01255 [Aeromicrobium sp. Root236]